MLQETTYQGFRYLLFRGDGLSERVLSGQGWEPHVAYCIEQLVAPGDVVADGGANFGVHTLALSRCVGEHGRVYAFEPQRIVFQQLCFHLFLNGVGNVRAYPQALGARHGRVKVPEFAEVDRRNIGATPVGEGSSLVDMVPLDHLQHETFRFIKADLQGCELAFLQGARGILARDRPLMLIEVEENWLRRLGASSKELIDAVLGMDYALARIETDWPTDHLCFPRERKAEVLAKVAGLPERLTLIEGRSVELTFSGNPYYDSCKAVS